MEDAPGAIPDLVAHAHERHVVVIGGGIAGLVAAHECAKVGLAVTLVEAGRRLGGTIGDAELDGMPVGTGVTCWATEGGAVDGLVEELALAGAVVQPAASSVWIAGLPSGAAPMPRETVRGIPANPWADGVRAIIGWSGAWRAYLDRLRPPMTIGVERSLARLVRSRMGDAVLERMVAPLTVGVYGIRPEEVDIDVAAPGLNGALTRTGSLGGAVAEALTDRSGGGIRSLAGGMPRLASALAERLRELSVDVRLGAEALRLDRDDAGRWILRLRDADDAAELDDAGGSDDAGGPDDTTEPIAPADAVIVATDEQAARMLLEPVVPGLAAIATPGPVDLETVTLVVESSALDDRPRGTACYPIPGTSAAASMLHETARWGWLAEAAGAGRHVLRLSFGTADEPPVTAGMDDAAAIERAADAAAELLGIPRAELTVRDGVRERHLLARPASVLGHAEGAAAVRAAIGATPGLAAVGAWVAGGGLAHTVDDAVAESDRVRRRLLWESDTPE